MFSTVNFAVVTGLVILECCLVLPVAHMSKKSGVLWLLCPLHTLGVSLCFHGLKLRSYEATKLRSYEPGF